MTILLYNDGRLVIDDGNPIEGNSLDGLVACVADPQSGDTLKYDGKQWVAGAAASGLPTVSGDDNGKVLTVVEGEWEAAAAGGGGSSALIVQLSGDTGTSDGYTFDKTAAEVLAAISAGGIVIVHFPDSNSETSHYSIVSEISFSQFGAYVVTYAGGRSCEFYCDTMNDYPYHSFD